MDTTDWWLCDSAPSRWMLEPKSWPRWVRRAFIVTLPISGPVWMTLATLTLFGMLVTIPIDAARNLARMWR